jgi:hypothetical protein
MLDNYWSIYLFRNFRAIEDAETFNRRIDILQQTMVTGLQPKARSIPILMQAGVEQLRHSFTMRRTIRGVKWAANTGIKFFFAKGLPPTAKGWGWKDPNIVFYVGRLTEAVKKLRYIMIVRNGLDMAFSKNRGMLFYHGRAFNVAIPSEPKLIPRAQLEFWYKVTRKGLDEGKKLGNRFLALSFEELCYHPAEVIKEIIEFADLSPSQAKLQELLKVVIIPKTIGRHKKRDLSIFSDADLAKVQEIEEELHVGQYD